MEAAFLPVQAPADAPRQAGAASEGRAHDTAEEGAAARGAQGPPPPLVLLGTGEAGWGCAGPGQKLRGCKWAARAALVLHLVDHGALQAQQARQAVQQAAAAGTDPPLLAPPSGAAGPPAPTAIYLFRSWEPQLAETQHQLALKALRKCDWGSHGFSLAAATSAAGSQALTSPATYVLTTSSVFSRPAGLNASHCPRPPVQEASWRLCCIAHSPGRAPGLRRRCCT